MFWRSCAKMFGLTLSKALVMSIKTQAVNSLRAKPVQIVLVRIARLSAHDLNFLNPNWDIGRVWELSSHQVRRLCISFSRTLRKQDASEIGRNFPEVFLGMRNMRKSFQESGNEPWRSMALKI